MTDFQFSQASVTSAIPAARIVVQANHLVPGVSDLLDELTVTISITAGTVVDDVGAIDFGFPLTRSTSNANVITTPALLATTDTTGAGRHLRTIEGGPVHYELTINGTVDGKTFNASHQFDVDAETPDLTLFTDLVPGAGSNLFPVLSPAARVILEATTDARVDELIGLGSVPGDSAYAIAVSNGFVGNEAAWLASLNGADGTDGVDGTVDAGSVVAAIDSAALTDAGTPAATDQILIKDASTGNLQTADFSDFAGTGEPAASTTVPGKVELATVTETNTGTDATRAVTPAGLAGTALKTKVDGIEALADVTDAANVVAALNSVTLTDPGTPTPTDRVLLKDAVTGVLQTADFADFAVGTVPYIAPAAVTGTTDTLNTGDHGRTNRYTNAALVTVTIPTDAADDLPDGFWCALFAQGAAGLTLSTAGVTLAGSSPKKTVAQNEILVVQKTSAANTWIVTGGTAA